MVAHWSKIYMVFFFQNMPWAHTFAPNLLKSPTFKPSLSPANTINNGPLTGHQTSLVAQSVKSLPTVWEARVRSLGWEKPLEEGMATLSGILAWRIPMGRGGWRATVGKSCNELDMGCKESDMTATKHSTQLVTIFLLLYPNILFLFAVKLFFKVKIK